MKTLLVTASLVLLGSASGAVADAPGVSRAAIRTAEQALDQRLSRIWPDTLNSLIAPTRGVYLDDYGAIFTAEISPVTAPGPISPMALLRPQQKTDLVQKKIARIPELKKALKEVLVETGASLDSVPLDQQVVLEVVVSRFFWESGGGYPAELIVQAPRRKLLELKRTNNAGMDAAIHLTER